jgi:hypothetical protein
VLLAEHRRRHAIVPVEHLPAGRSKKTNMPFLGSRTREKSKRENSESDRARTAKTENAEEGSPGMRRQSGLTRKWSSPRLAKPEWPNRTSGRSEPPPRSSRPISVARGSARGSFSSMESLSITATGSSPRREASPKEPTQMSPFLGWKTSGPWPRR